MYKSQNFVPIVHLESRGAICTCIAWKRAWWLVQGHTHAKHVLVSAGWSNYCTFDLRAILQKRVNSRGTANKMMYSTTHSQDLKLRREYRSVKWVCLWNCCTVAVNNLLRYLWLRYLWHCRPF